MRRVLKIALATAAIAAFAAPAAATTLADGSTLAACSNGQSCVQGTTNVNLDSFNTPGATTVTGTVGNNGQVVDFYVGAAPGTTDLITNPGAATVLTASGADLTSLTFQLMSGTFTAAEFNLDSSKTTPTQLAVTLTDSAGETSAPITINTNGLNDFYLIAGPGVSYTSATFTSADGGFLDMKQLRLVLGAAAVPEPATWAMMLLGFGGMGVAMRRSRRRNGALMQVA